MSGHTNGEATFEAGEPVCYYADSTNTVWFKWDCAQAGSLTLSTAGSTNTGATEWDAVVCVYQGASLDALTLLKARDSDASTIDSTSSNGSFYMMLGGFSDTIGGLAAVEGSAPPNGWR